MLQNSQSGGAYFFQPTSYSDQWRAPGGGETLDALRLVIDASFVSKFSTWPTEGDSREPIHCTGAGPTILAVWLWSSQAKYSRRQVFLAVKRVPVFSRQRRRERHRIQFDPKSAHSVLTCYSGHRFPVSWFCRHTHSESTVGAVESSSHCHRLPLPGGKSWKSWGRTDRRSEDK